MAALAARLEALGLSRVNLHEEDPPELGSFALTSCLRSRVVGGLEDENSSDTGMYAWAHELLDTQVTVVKTLIWQVRAIFLNHQLPYL